MSRIGTYMMHTVVPRYSSNNMKIAKVSQTFNGSERFDTVEQQYNNMNHNSETIDCTDSHAERSVECFGGKGKIVTNCNQEAVLVPPAINRKMLTEEETFANSDEASNKSDINLNVHRADGNSSNSGSTLDKINGLDRPVNHIIGTDDLLIGDFKGGNSETKSDRIARQLNKIEQLKGSLLCEEAMLTMVRKLMDSQRKKDAINNHSKHPPVSQSVHQRQSLAVPRLSAPPPKHMQTVKSSKHGSVPAPAQKYYVQVGNQLVPASAPSTNATSTSYHVNGGTASSHTYRPPAPPKPVPPKQTPEQKQNAAKAALHRQLEQTLLQIPPPRPPPAGWKAIPNVNSIDFMMLVGLDEVVDSILDMDSKPTLRKALDELVPHNPRICSQCSIDFSPCWKNKAESKKVVLCERCSLQNVKKDLKSEHTTRLKSAFLKALKQQQEIEEKIKAGEDVVIANISPVMEKNENSASPGANAQPSMRISSPKSIVTGPVSRNHISNDNQKDSPAHKQRPVIQHYPLQSPLVQELHQQHRQQEQPLKRHTTSTSSSRWHPYRPPLSSSSQSHREHNPSYHRTNASHEGPPRHYVVHHPQRGGRGRVMKR